MTNDKSHRHVLARLMGLKTAPDRAHCFTASGAKGLCSYGCIDLEPEDKQTMMTQLIYTITSNRNRLPPKARERFHWDRHVSIPGTWTPERDRLLDILIEEFSGNCYLQGTALGEPKSPEMLNQYIFFRLMELSNYIPKIGEGWEYPGICRAIEGGNIALSIGVSRAISRFIEGCLLDFTSAGRIQYDHDGYISPEYEWTADRDKLFRMLLNHYSTAAF